MRKCMSLLALSLLLMGGNWRASAQEMGNRTTNAPKDRFFYVYKDQGSPLNHYIPSGWMGDYGDLAMRQDIVRTGTRKRSQGDMSQAPASSMMTLSLTKPTGTSNTHTEDRGRGAAAPGSRNTCMQIKYSAQKKQGAGWAGIYWQHPPNNWGDKKGGFDLSAYSKLTFEAKGEQGGEVIDKFLVGGITGQSEEGDSDNVALSPVTLSKTWKRYEINLRGHDLRHIIGGFGFAANSDNNPRGFAMYLDEIRFEQ